MLELKDYQKRVLETLAGFLEHAQIHGAEAAHKIFAGRKDENDNFENPYYMPYSPTATANIAGCPHVCLRVPTGGGKTYMAACALPKLAAFRLASHPFGMRAPLVLWLAPSDIILKQTKAVLADRKHPCGAALRRAFGQMVRVVEVKDFDAIPIADYRTGGCIFISTTQMFNVRDRFADNPEGMSKASRRIYDDHESLDPHFDYFMPSTPPAGLHLRPDGRPYRSFANLLHLLRPIMVSDEAHRFITNLSQTVMQRINPSCIVEWTATPRESNNDIIHNVLASVSADELWQENMVKLPVRVAEHGDWEQAVHGAVNERKRLATIAVDSEDTVRPIALYKADNINGEVPVTKLKSFLMTSCGVPESEIKIATGDIRELEGIDLLAAKCTVNHIITVEALREGWDCSYAYILCSTANVLSATAAEQLLGRIMRMPHATMRKAEELNHAYAHFPAAYSTAAVEVLRKNMADELGFNESSGMHYIQAYIPQMEDTLQEAQPAAVITEGKPDFSVLPEEVREDAESVVTIKPAEKKGEYEVVINAPISLPTIEAIIAAVPDRQKAQARQTLHNASMRLAQKKAPSENGVSFGNLSQLLFFSEDAGDFVTADSENLHIETEWNNIAEEHFLLRDFSINETAEVFEISMKGGKATIDRKGVIDELPFPESSDSGHQQRRLCQWLERQIRDPDGKYFPETLAEFVNQNIEKLLQTCSLSSIERARNHLAGALRDLLQEHDYAACQNAIQKLLFDNKELKSDACFMFPNRSYSPGPDIYAGNIVFKKHYYPAVGKMDNTQEEFCAIIIDKSAEVKHWVRNLPQKPWSYKLPPYDKSGWDFYPDFVVELKNGKKLVIEHKGGHLRDAEAKNRIGELMEKKSDGDWAFLMVVSEQPKGAHPRIEHAINQKIAALSSQP